MAAPRPELLAFLQACKEEPDDDAPRLVLADWLDDQGETALASLIRLQCRAARMSHRERRHQRTEERASALARACEGWLRPLREAGLTVGFSRGLLTVNAALDDARHAALRQLADTELWAWVESLGVHGGPWRLPELRRWLCSGVLGGVAALALSNFTLDEPEAEALASAEWPFLRHLSLAPWQVTGAGLRRLGLSPLARSLRALSLSLHRRRVPWDVPAPLAGGRWDQLKNLTLQATQIGDAGALALSKAKWLANLTCLDVQANNIGPRGVRALLAGRRALPVRCVHLNANPIGDKGAAVVAASGGLEALSSLNLSHCSIGPEGAAALASAQIANLTALNLSHNQIGDAGAEALARSPNVENLCELHLSANVIGDAGARALAGSPHFRRLKTLSLFGSSISDPVRQLLRERFGRGVVL